MALSDLTLDELMEKNRPYLEKLHRRERLTPEEESEHQAIIEEARKREEAQRAQDVEERNKRLAERPPDTKREPFWFRKVG